MQKYIELQQVNEKFWKKLVLRTTLFVVYWSREGLHETDDDISNYCVFIETLIGFYNDLDFMRVKRITQRESKNLEISICLFIFLFHWFSTCKDFIENFSKKIKGKRDEPTNSEESNPLGSRQNFYHAINKLSRVDFAGVYEDQVAEHEQSQNSQGCLSWWIFMTAEDYIGDDENWHICV